MNGTVACSSAPPNQVASSDSRSAPMTSENSCAGCELAQAADRAQGAALAPSVRSMSLTMHARPERRRRQLAHREPVLERRQLLAERVLVAGTNHSSSTGAVSST